MVSLSSRGITESTPRPGGLESATIAVRRQSFEQDRDARTVACERCSRQHGTEAERVHDHVCDHDRPESASAEEVQPRRGVASTVCTARPLNEQIAAADRRIAALTNEDASVALLTSAPSISPITAAAIVATIDDVTRFRSAHQFEAFLGVVPGERSSGETRRIGRITKAGNARARYLLVEAGWRILRAKDVETEALRTWAMGIAARRGKRVAVVALARRLAGILYAMCRDQRPYDAAQLRLPRSRAA
jgi:hypothetical protein